jgi:hypothetical protein
MNPEHPLFGEWARASNRVLADAPVLSSVPTDVAFEADVGAEMIRRGAAVGYLDNTKIDWGLWHLHRCRRTPGLRLVTGDNKRRPPMLETKATTAYRRPRRPV